MFQLDRTFYYYGEWKLCTSNKECYKAGNRPSEYQGIENKP